MAAFQIEGDLRTLWIQACRDIPATGSQSGYELKEDAETAPDPEAWLINFQSTRNDGKFAAACSKMGRRMNTIQLVLQVIGFTVDMGAMAFPAISPAALIVNAFAWLFNSFAKVSEKFDAIESLFNKITDEFESLLIIKDCLKKDFPLALQQRVVRLFISCLKIYRIGSEQPVKRLKAWFSQLKGDDSLQLAICEFESASEALKSFFPIATYGNVEALREAEEKLIRRADRDEILSWLSTCPHQKMHDLIRGQIPRTGGPTKFGKWLLDSDPFKYWEEENVNKIWYTGNPGAGKSVLASIIIERLRANSRSVAYLYLSYTSKPEVKELLGSIVRQLQPENGIHPAIVDKFETAKNKGKFKDNEQVNTKNEIHPPSEEEIENMLTEICKGKAIFIIVDALDEFDYDNREKLLKYLTNVGTDVKLLVTSRILQHLKTLQNGFSTAKIEANDQDMDEYIRCELDSHASMQKFQDQRERIQKTIKQKSGRMFIIVRLHVKAVLDAGNRAELDAVLEFLPVSIYDTYKDAMKRIRRQSSAGKSRAESVLSWVAFAQRQLTTNELQHALAIQERGQGSLDSYLRDVTDLMSECHGLVVADSEDMVRFVHRSAREFFDNHRDFVFPYADREITINCVKYLSAAATAPRHPKTLARQGLVTSVNYGADSGTDSDKCSITNDMEKNYPLTRYAGAFLHKHHRKVRDTQQDGEFLTAVRNFVAREWTRAIYGRLLSKYKAYDSKSIIPYKGKTRTPRHSDWESFDSLQLAVYLRNPKLVQDLIRQGADINVADPYGRTPLEIAIDCGLDSIAGILLQHGAEVDLSTKKGHSILQHAMERDYWNVVSQIIGSSNHDPSDDDFLKIIGLVLMVLFALLEVLASLLFRVRPKSSPSMPEIHEDSHSELDLPEKYRALLQHSYEGKVDNLRDLLNPKALEPIAVHLVREGGENGKIDKHYTDDDNLSKLDELKKTFLKTACFLAVEKDQHRVVCTFLDHGVTPNLTNLRGQSLLHRATFRNDEKLVNTLLNRDVIVDQRDRNGRSALTAYADPEREKVLKLLLDKHADINLKQNADIHEIYEAAVFGAQAAVKFFLDQGVDPSIANYYGWTPLHGAAANGHIDIVKLLVNKGANVSPRSDTNDTPLDLVMDGRKHYDRILSGWGQYAAQVIDTKKRNSADKAETRDNIISFLREHKAKLANEICECAEEFEFEYPERKVSWWDTRRRQLWAMQKHRAYF